MCSRSLSRSLVLTLALVLSVHLYGGTVDNTSAEPLQKSLPAEAPPATDLASHPKEVEPGTTPESPTEFPFPEFPTPDPSSLWGTLLKQLLVIGLFAGVLWGGLRFWKRRMYAPTTANARFRIVERHWVSKQVQVLVVEYDEQTLLFGVTPNEISLMAPVESLNQKSQAFEALLNTHKS